VDYVALEAKALEVTSGTGADTSEANGTATTQAGEEQATGTPGNTFPTKYDVPRAHGGPIALLMVANLNVEGGVASFGRALQGMGPRRAEERCTVEQLKLAQEFGRALSMSVTQGRDSPLWKHMRDALVTLRGTQMERRAVVEILGELLLHKRGTDDLLEMRPDYVDPPGMSLNSCIDHTRATLATIDPAFGVVTGDELRTLIDGAGSPHNIGPIGIAVKLSMKCGAFGDAQKEHETLSVATKRVKRNYEKAGVRDPRAQELRKKLGKKPLPS
jgi:hypothetical protein